MVNNTEKTASAGRVLIMPRGEWNANTTYEMLDLVNHNGYAWLAKRTVVGIEPSDSYPEYWHNMLAIQEIIENAIANTVADDVSAILENKYRDMLSEARYVTDLKADFTTATFVQWDAETNNTPYKAGMTENTDGFALVQGTATENHTIVAWTVGTEKADCFICGVSGDWESYLATWEKYLPLVGGTITGSLGLGGGKGSVSADAEGAFLEAIKDSSNYRKIVVENPSASTLDKAAKFVSCENGIKEEHTLFGEHNLPNAAQIKYGTYRGGQECGAASPNRLSADFDIKLCMVYSTAMGLVSGSIDGRSNTGMTIMGLGGQSYTFNDASGTQTGYYTINGKEIEWYVNYTNGSSYDAQYNRSNVTYNYILIG